MSGPGGDEQCTQRFSQLCPASRLGPLGPGQKQDWTIFRKDTLLKMWKATVMFPSRRAALCVCACVCVCVCVHT